MSFQVLNPETFGVRKGFNITICSQDAPRELKCEVEDGSPMCVARMECEVGGRLGLEGGMRVKAKILKYRRVLRATLEVTVTKKGLRESFGFIEE